MGVGNGGIADVLGVSVQDFFAQVGGSSEKEMALDDLVTLLTRSQPHEIQMVQDLAVTLLERIDQYHLPKSRPKAKGQASLCAFELTKHSHLLIS